MSFNANNIYFMENNYHFKRMVLFDIILKISLISSLVGNSYRIESHLFVHSIFYEISLHQGSGKLH